MANPRPASFGSQRPVGDSIVPAVLSLGSTGSAVSELQAKLTKLGFGPVSVTGSFDALTAEALKQFQSSVGLPADGVFGPNTSRALDAKILGTGFTVGGQTVGGGPAEFWPTGEGTSDAAPDSATPPARPFWQLGLMILGGIALAGGVLYILTKEGDHGKALPAGRTPEQRRKDAWAKASAKRAALRGADEKCMRTPDDDAFEDGKPVERHVGSLADLMEAP